MDRRTQFALAAPPVPEWFVLNTALTHGVTSTAMAHARYDEAATAQWPWYYADIVLAAEENVKKDA